MKGRTSLNAPGHDYRILCNFLERTQPIMGSPECGRASYRNADPFERDRFERYLELVASSFHAQDPRRDRAIANWESHFAPYATALKTEILAWRKEPALYRSLTDIIWAVSERGCRRGEGHHLLDFDDGRQRFFERLGVISLAKLLCLEIEAETQA